MRGFLTRVLHAGRALAFTRAKHEAGLRRELQRRMDAKARPLPVDLVDEIVERGLIEIEERAITLLEGQRLAVDARLPPLPGELPSYPRVVGVFGTFTRGAVREARYRGRPYATPRGANIDFPRAQVQPWLLLGPRSPGEDIAADAWDVANGFAPAFDMRTALGPVTVPTVRLVAEPDGCASAFRTWPRVSRCAALADAKAIRELEEEFEVPTASAIHPGD